MYSNADHGMPLVHLPEEADGGGRSDTITTEQIDTNGHANRNAADGTDEKYSRRHKGQLSKQMQEKICKQAQTDPTRVQYVPANALSLPVKTIAPTSGSFSNASTAEHMSSISPLFNAFSACRRIATGREGGVVTVGEQREGILSTDTV